MFLKSVEIEKKLQENSSNGVITFFKITTELGNVGAIIPMIFIIFLFFPINKSYAFISVITYSVYIDNVLKIMYGNPRPFWIDNSLAKACDGGFGNPSGHSFSSSAIYLTLWHLITDLEIITNQSLIKIMILILTILIIITVVMSRVFLGVHGINQIIYGSLLGIGLYYLIIYIFEIHKKSGKEFFYMFEEKSLIIKFSIKYFILVLLLILLYFFVPNDYNTYSKVLIEKCPHIHSYRKFNEDGLFGGLLIFAMIGTHYGIYVLRKFTLNYYNKEEEINYWYRGSAKNHFYRILIMIIVSLPILINLIIPNDSSLAIIFIFKVSIPYAVVLFLLFFACIYLSIKFKIANQNIFKNIDIISMIDLEKTS